MYIKKPLLLIISIVEIVGIVGCTGTLLDTTSSSGTQINDNTSPSTPTAPSTSLTDSNKQAYLDAINNVRATARTCGSQGFYNAVPALSWNDNLYKTSLEHSQDMATTNTFAHTGSNTLSDLTAQGLSLGHGSTLGDRIDYNGYTSWRALGENIAAGNSTTEATIAQWISSDGHCANMMSPSFTEVGMSHAQNSSSTYTHYWTQTFGAR